MKNTRLVTACLIASIFAGLSAMGVVSAARSSDSCSELEVMLDALAGRRVALRDMRGPLYGDGTDGWAWHQYNVAAAAIQAIPKFYRQTSAAAAATTEAEVAARDELLAHAAPVLEYLSRGAHCEDATSQVRVMKGLSARIQRHAVVHSIGELAVAKAEFLLESGESVRAVQHLLDAQQMARDLLQSPLQIERAIGCAYVVPGSMARFLEPGALDRFSDEAVALWLDGVERMQASFGAASRSYAGDLECDLPGVFGHLGYERFGTLRICEV